jgi:hypothetical protein
MNEEFRPLAEALYRERVLRARRTPLEARLMQGADLFDLGCETMLMGLRVQMPGASEAELKSALRGRLARGRKLESQSR